QENWNERESITDEEWMLYTVSHTENLTEGPTVLLCMNVPDGKTKQITDQFEYLKEKNRFDQLWDRSIQPYYEKSQMVQNTESEILLTWTANGFILLILMIMAVFQYFLFVKEEESNWKWDNDFLEKLGMKEKDRLKKIVFQLRFFILFPMALALIGGVLFTVMTVRARFFIATEIAQYGIVMGIVYGLYVLIWFGVYKAMKRGGKQWVMKKK